MRFLRQRREQVLFVLVGAWNTVFAYAIWALLEYLLQDRLNYWAILVLAWPIAVMNAYVWHRHFVFRSSGRVRDELPRFSLVYVATLAGAIVALPVLMQAMPFSIYAIQAGYTLAVVVLSYLAHRYFSFKHAARPLGESGPHEVRHGGS